MKGKIVTTKLPESAVDFLRYLKAKNKSNETIKGYTSDLRTFFNFISTYKKKKEITKTLIRSITLKDLYMFMSYLQEDIEDKNGKIKNRNSSYARARKTACLKSYYEYIYKVEKIVSENVAEDLICPDIDKKNPIYLSLEECQVVLNSMDKGAVRYYRDYCIMTLFLHTGMRVSELANILLDNIKDDMLIIKGKGNKERTIYLNETCLKVLNIYLEKKDMSKMVDGKLFDVKKNAIEALVKKHITHSGIKNSEVYTPHKLRHTASMLMYKYGDVGLAELKDILGHKNISTTNIYAHADNDTLRKAVKNNPLNNL